MRILVQDSVNEVFYDGLDWNRDASKAKDFGSVAQAETFCRANQLSEALIVLKSKDGKHDVSYPAGERNAVVVSKPPTTQIKRLC
jgi:hypothetical protein